MRHGQDALSASSPARSSPGRGALIALERGARRMIALLREVIARGGSFTVPAGALAQAWRDGRTQVALARFARSRSVEVDLDEALAKA